MTHAGCVGLLKKIGRCNGFYVDDGIKLGKMYHLGNPDCVWYFDCKGNEPLMKIVKGDTCKEIDCRKTHGEYRYLPLVAFEVPNSEHEKALRGSLMSLQLANASASVIVLIGKSAGKHELYTHKLTGRFSSMRLRIWTEDYMVGLARRLHIEQ